MTEEVRPKWRPPRRHVRLRCVLDVAGTKVEGRSHNISSSGLLAQVASAEMEPLTLAVGDRLPAELFLPGQNDPVNILSQIAWWDPSDQDFAGREMVSLGLHFVCPPAHRNAVTRFIDDFRYTVLVVDDEPINVQLVQSILREDYRVIGCQSAEEALEVLEKKEVAVVITDQRMPVTSGLEFLKKLNERFAYAQTQKIVLTGYPNIEEVCDFFNEAGIFYFVPKPLNVSDFTQIVRRAVDAYAMAVENLRLQGELERRNRELRRENEDLRRRVASMELPEPIITESTSMRQLMRALKAVAPTDATILLDGETGTGKEIVARAVHSLSSRSEKAWVAVNCAALPESLIESELFGHERGAFTGATTRRLGRFERAHMGTLFVDEIGDLPLGMQVKLLRVLQEGTLERVGGSTTVQVDVRLIAATHRDLEQMVDDGAFREDLFYRLNVVPMTLPPLRERPEDIWPLTLHFLRRFQGKMGKQGIRLSDNLRQAFEGYAWPGNIRELINAVERTVALTESNGLADVPHIQLGGRRRTPRPLRPAPPAEVTGTLTDVVGNVEAAVIRGALNRVSGNRTQAARELGVTRQTLAMKIKKYQISV